MVALLNPKNTSGAARACCLLLGAAYPVYRTFKALERRGDSRRGGDVSTANPLEQWLGLGGDGGSQGCLTYWSVFGCMSIAEASAEPLFQVRHLLPLTQPPKPREGGTHLLANAALTHSFAFPRFPQPPSQWFPWYYHCKLGFLVWLQSQKGAEKLYREFLRPFLLKHEDNVDAALGYVEREVETHAMATGNDLNKLFSLAGATSRAFRDALTSFFNSSPSS